MSTIIIAFFTVVLILVCAFMVLIILMQRASSNAGMGSALGGSAMESALGGGASNVLTRGTVLATTLFFVIAFCLYLAHMARYEGKLKSDGSLPTIEAVAPEPVEPAAPSALQGALTDTTTDAADLEASAGTSEPQAAAKAVAESSQEPATTSTESSQVDTTVEAEANPAPQAN